MTTRTTPSRDNFPANGSELERLRYLVRYAILAPSGHNTQPWRFTTDAAGLHLLADRFRALPVVDPHDRALTISCGGALEHLLIAARCLGQETSVVLFPTEDPDHLATVRLTGPVPADEPEKAMFAAMLSRRTTRAPYESRALPGELLHACREQAAQCGATLATFTSEDRKVKFAELIAEGDRAQFADPRFRKELSEWVRSRHSPRHDGISGEALGMADFLTPVGALVVRAFDMGKFIGEGDRDKVLKASPVLAVLFTDGDGRSDWMKAGRALARVLLMLASSGATAAFLNQPIEVDTLRPRVRAEAGANGLPQLLLRFGYGRDVRASARRSVEEVID